MFEKHYVSFPQKPLYWNICADACRSQGNENPADHQINGFFFTTKLLYLE